MLVWSTIPKAIFKLEKAKNIAVPIKSKIMYSDVLNL